MLQLGKLTGNLFELAVFPRRRSVMIKQSEESLLLASSMRVEGPGEKCLAVVDQAEVGPHANDALWAAVRPASSSHKFVEPRWRRQIAFHKQGAASDAKRIARVEPLSAIADVSLVGAKVIKPPASCGVP